MKQISYKIDPKVIFPSRLAEQFYSSLANLGLSPYERTDLMLKFWQGEMQERQQEVLEGIKARLDDINSTLYSRGG